jgi:hypothetical protein
MVLLQKAKLGREKKSTNEKGRGNHSLEEKDVKEKLWSGSSGTLLQFQLRGRLDQENHHWS